MATAAREIGAAHDLQDALHRPGIEEGTLADEEIILGEDADEIEAEVAGGRLDAKTRIRHAARDIGRDGGVGELDLLRAVDLALVDAVRGKQLVEQQARAGIMVAVDEADFWWSEEAVTCSVCGVSADLARAVTRLGAGATCV